MVWFFVFNVGSPMFVTFVTIMFMALWCDTSTSIPFLVQDPDILCYSDKHITMARYLELLLQPKPKHLLKLTLFIKYSSR